MGKTVDVTVRMFGQAQMDNYTATVTTEEASTIKASVVNGHEFVQVIARDGSVVVIRASLIESVMLATS